MIINILLVLLFVLNAGWAIANFQYEEWMLGTMNVITILLLVLCMVERWR